jgi:15-cis-phytoene synthase
VSGRELDAAGITDPGLRAAYEQCRLLNAAHGRTYYLSTLLLPAAKRPHVHALYGFARYADELVDDLDSPDPAELVRWGDRFLADLAAADGGAESSSGTGTCAHVDHPVSRAAIHTARTWDIPTDTFEAFLESMRMDITVTGYPTYADLEHYMYGSAAVIGLQMVPILEPLPGREQEAADRAQALGEAFQLSNFIRDVAEDLRRGRVYLPQEDLDRFVVSRADLAPGPTPPHVVELLRFEIARTRELYATARPGIELLHPTSRDCIRTALALYGGILDAVEKADYQVLDRRVAVPLPRRLAVAVPGLVRARRARRTRARLRPA